MHALWSFEEPVTLHLTHLLYLLRIIHLFFGVFFNYRSEFVLREK